MSKPARGLPSQAYEILPGDQYPPYVAADQTIPEFTFKAGLVGVLIGILFGAANAYLGLKVGLTVSASIPAAVMSVAVFRAFRLRATVLENNIVQTIASTGEAVAAGVIFTLPALLLLGFQPGVLKIFIIAVIGGVLGVLFMVPLRRYLMSREHGRLPYPEGTACAEVLVAADEGGAHARAVFLGLGLGAVYEFLMSGLKLWPATPRWKIPRYPGAEFSGEASAALLGVGFVLGPEIAAIMFAGGVMAWLVIIPLITLFGANSSAVIYPAAVPIAAMSVHEIWHNYIRYLGAGAVAVGGLITLLRSIPTIIGSFRHGLLGLAAAGKQTRLRTDRDLPLWFILAGTLGMIPVLWLMPANIIHANLLTACLIVLFSFFFVTVSSRIVGLIGSSSNPISGMTIATLLATALIFFALGWTDTEHQAIVLSIGAVVCIAAANAGDTSQDLKTGFLLGATPRAQQIGELVGVLTASAVIGLVVLRLHRGLGIGSAALPAPQATLMALVVKGVLTQQLPWGLVLIGACLAAVMELLGLHSLPFAVGLYLPLSMSTPVFVGGAVRWWLDRRARAEELKEQRERGVLYASGLIAGSAFIGMALGLVQSFDRLKFLAEKIALGDAWAGEGAAAVAVLFFAALAYSLHRMAIRKRSEP